MSLRVFQFGSKRIQYRLEYRARTTLGITVTPDLHVIVRAPIGAAEERVAELLRKRAPWILKQLDDFMVYQPRQSERKYVGGETHLYLGRQYLLRIYHGKRERVDIVGRELRVVCRKKSDVRRLVLAWYKMNARLRLAKYAEPWINHFKQYGVSPAGIALRTMRTRWGTCSVKGRILLNTELIKAPKGCIECVIVHELCHLVHRNHSKQFYELQSRVLPGWEKWKERLERAMV